MPPPPLNALEPDDREPDEPELEGRVPALGLDGRFAAPDEDGLVAALGFDGRLAALGLDGRVEGRFPLDGVEGRVEAVAPPPRLPPAGSVLGRAPLARDGPEPQPRDSMVLAEFAEPEERTRFASGCHFCPRAGCWPGRLPELIVLPPRLMVLPPRLMFWLKLRLTSMSTSPPPQWQPPWPQSQLLAMMAPTATPAPNVISGAHGS